MKKILLYIFLALVLLALQAVLFNWMFVTRMLTYPGETAVTAVDWYTPKAIVPGRPGTPVPVAVGEEAGFTAAALDSIVEYAGQNNSAALLVLHRGRIALEKYWEGHSAQSTTNAMSMAKTVLALLVGVAIEDGFIDSEADPVAKYIPEWAGDARADITIKDMLQMSSGLRVYADQNDPFSDLVQIYLGTDAAATALKVPQVQPPGGGFFYNNVNTQVLGVLLERATGQPFAEYLSHKIWQPIGAGDAAYWLDREGGMAKTFCCFFATARDWLRLGQMMLDRGRVGEQQVIPESWLQKMLTPTPFEPDYGLHVWLAYSEDGRRKKHRSEPFIARDMFYLDGADIQRVYVIPSYELVIVRVGNDVPGMWDDAFVPNTLIRGTVKERMKGKG